MSTRHTPVSELPEAFLRVVAHRLQLQNEETLERLVAYYRLIPAMLERDLNYWEHMSQETCAWYLEVLDEIVRRRKASVDAKVAA